MIIMNFEKTFNPNQEKKVEEVSTEQINRALETIYKTLEIDSDEDIDDFDEILKKATKSLPQYQKVERGLDGTDYQDIPYALFQMLKKDLDEQSTNQSISGDGVLIKSMREGSLECAGRTMIASTFLQEREVDHAVVYAPGHAFLIIELPGDSLAYFDPNNNLYFTFPKSSLEGYRDTKTTSECKMKEYEPRDGDFFEGIGTAYSHFVTLPPQEGIGRHYLGNISAALHGNEEFDSSFIPVDEEASQATHHITSKIYGNNEVIEDFQKRVETLIQEEEQRTEYGKKVIDDILKKHPHRDDFISHLIKKIDTDLGYMIPYVKNASVDQKQSYAEKVWNYLNSRTI